MTLLLIRRATLNVLKLLNDAELKLLEANPVFNHKAETVLAILRSKGVLPYRRSTLNGSLHKQVSAALVNAYEANTTIDVTTRRVGTLHEQGHSTKVLTYLDDMVKHGLLVSQTKKARGLLLRVLSQ